MPARCVSIATQSTNILRDLVICAGLNSLMRSLNETAADQHPQAKYLADQTGSDSAPRAKVAFAANRRLRWDNLTNQLII